jgi:hypothetical protein
MVAYVLIPKVAFDEHRDALLKRAREDLHYGYFQYRGDEVVVAFAQERRFLSLVLCSNMGHSTQARASEIALSGPDGESIVQITACRDALASILVSGAVMMQRQFRWRTSRLLLAGLCTIQQAEALLPWEPERHIADSFDLS